MIKPGDIVSIRFASNDALPVIQEGQMEVDCILVSLPRGAGDLMQFKTNREEGRQNLFFALNPLSPVFVGLVATGKTVPVLF
jgi:hypothetical protein